MLMFVFSDLFAVALAAIEFATRGFVAMQDHCHSLEAQVRLWKADFLIANFDFVLGSRHRSSGTKASVRLK